ncbi:MAG: ABC transporter substrate-binding protein [Alphaproteobacteria bacterium]|nr:ABC transporter substrate-binding protein [Alphaproteobacteria bacterium]
MKQSHCEVRAGFIPLVDCAPLVAACELGFAEAEGINLTLSRETSWATVRDKLAVSHFDAAHILAPMPVAANLGLGPLPTPMVVPMALGTGANSITVSMALWDKLSEHMQSNDFDATASIDALAKVLQRRSDCLPQLQLGIVHPHSAHHYELAYWLASRGIMPGRDVDLVVVPPSLMPAALASGHIDGFCAGEPWGTVAANDGAGVILTTNAHIWRNSPEKVLGVRSAWAEQNPDCLEAVVRAVYRAAEWCDQSENQDDLARLLAKTCYVAQSIELIRPCLARRLKAGDGTLHPIEGFLSFATNAATFPWASQALWFYSQMVRWGQALPGEAAEFAARKTYRPDIYRSALKPLGIAIPSANAKVEGALQGPTPVGSTSGHLRLGPDTFFDGKIFDPDQLSAYLAGFSKGRS